MLTGVTVYLIAQFTFERLDVSIAHVLAALLGPAIVWFFFRSHVIRQINTEEFWLTASLIRSWRALKQERAG
jgi:hypothetical protein